MRDLPEDRNGFRFRGGSTVLDLAATLQARQTAAPRDLLAHPEDLDRWLVSAGLAASLPGATENDLAAARILREAIFALACSLQNPLLDAAACQILNQIAAEPAAAPALTADGRVELRGLVAGLLASLARDAVRLFGGRDSSRIRQCQSASCSIFFVDTSRSGDRRWCSMSGCGNKAKVAEFRRRKRQSE
ncbi:CGNR zinc finger domain-containing protein [Methylovirgula sp. 4M-Z18]|uniref:CGNR zinc finger domain-containing protein n=1 Tax=Methylovirgula sp. 4M-Z18 TaxID=2293567 RepID=UPI000E2FEFE0|nr:ABATE domain-containing protein [Methylovirgula sp. 4M-Z18]RFB81502.1 hypothetical protein DYH55_02980 [Methylovirgula sp. 4M-Z18]